MLYTLTELPTLIPDPNNLGSYLGRSWAQAINDKAEIVGFSETASGNTRAVLWQGQNIKELGTLDPDPGNPGQFRGDSYATDINENGTVVGVSYHSDLGDARAFLWTSGTMKQLQPPNGYVLGFADSINNQGTVVGKIRTPISDLACVWDPAGNSTLLGIPPSPFPGRPWEWSWARAINDKNEIAVWAGDFELGNSAHLWSAGNWFNVPGNPPPPNLYPTAINNKSILVGLSFTWNLQVGFHILSATAPFTYIWPYAINDNDVIVGGGADQTGLQSAALIWFYGAMDLNTSIPPNSGCHLVRALGTNNQGQIVGVGQRGNRDVAFLLTPTEHTNLQIATTAIVMKIISGVLSDSGGAVIHLVGPGGPTPWPPWGPERQLLPSSIQNLAVAKNLLSTAQQISDPEIRSQLESIARKLGGIGFQR